MLHQRPPRGARVLTFDKGNHVAREGLLRREQRAHLVAPEPCVLRARPRQERRGDAVHERLPTVPWQVQNRHEAVADVEAGHVRLQRPRLHVVLYHREQAPFELVPIPVHGLEVAEPSALLGHADDDMAGTRIEHGHRVVNKLRLAPFRREVDRLLEVVGGILDDRAVLDRFAGRQSRGFRRHDDVPPPS